MPLERVFLRLSNVDSYVGAPDGAFEADLLYCLVGSVDGCLEVGAGSGDREYASAVGEEGRLVLTVITTIQTRPLWSRRERRAGSRRIRNSQAGRR